MSFVRNAAAALLLAVLLMAGMTAGATAQPGDLPQLGPRAAPTQHVQVDSLPSLNMTPDFDPASATARYLAQVSGEARARSDAYFVGGYWLQLAELIYALAVAGLLLWTGTSARIQDWAQSRTPRRGYQVMLYAAAYVPIIMAATFPLTVYEGFFREHRYGLSTQTFWQWLSDFGIQFGLTFAATVLLLPILYLAIRRGREMWPCERVTRPPASVSRAGCCGCRGTRSPGRPGA